MERQDRKIEWTVTPPPAIKYDAGNLHGEFDPPKTEPELLNEDGLEVVREECADEVVIEEPRGELDPKPPEVPKPERKAKRLMELIEGGKSPKAAARSVGIPWKAIENDAQMKAAIGRLLEIGAIKQEVKKEAVRAGLFKMFMEGIANDDFGGKKLALEASKQLAGDLGLGQNADVQVNVNLGVLEGLERDLTLPGVSNPFRPASDATIDVSASLEGTFQGDRGPQNTPSDEGNDEGDKE